MPATDTVKDGVHTYARETVNLFHKGRDNRRPKGAKVSSSAQLRLRLYLMTSELARANLTTNGSPLPNSVGSALIADPIIVFRCRISRILRSNSHPIFEWGLLSAQHQKPF